MSGEQFGDEVIERKNRDQREHHRFGDGETNFAWTASGSQAGITGDDHDYDPEDFRFDQTIGDVAEFHIGLQITKKLVGRESDEINVFSDDCTAEPTDEISHHREHRHYQDNREQPRQYE